MSLNRTKTWLAAGLLVVLPGASAFAQVQDMQLFRPAEISSYGGGARPNEGFFFVFDGLSWALAKPEATTIGFKNLTRNVYYAPDVMVVQKNTHDTGGLKGEFTEGNRIQFGHMAGHWGWTVESLVLKNQNQTLMASAVDMVFSDPPFGPGGSQLLEGYVDEDLTILENLPVTFDDVFIRNRLEMWGVEWMCTYRTHPTHQGGLWELSLGVRYLELDEEFTVDGLGGILNESIWSTEAENHLIGPQAGVRWFRKCGRWSFSTEGRFFAGFNGQNIHQRGTLGTDLVPPGGQNLPLAMAATSFSHTNHVNEWSPAADVRVDLKYQLTRAVSLRAGWSGMWMDGIARASNLINYEVSTMGIEMAHNRQDIFVHGPSFGIEVNR